MFLLLMLMVQIAGAVTARNAAAAAAEASARRTAVGSSEPSLEEEALAAVVAASVPGAENVIARVRLGDTVSTARVSFRWTPPGPLFRRLTITVEASHALSVPP